MRTPSARTSSPTYSTGLRTTRSPSASRVRHPRTPGRYAQFMGKPHDYGTFVEITAAAALFQRRIVVVRGGHVECHVGLMEWPMLVMEFSGDRGKGHFDLLWPSGVELHRSTVPYVSPPPRPSLRQLAMEDVVVELRAYYNAVVEAMEVTQGDGNVAESRSSSSSGVQCGDSGVVERGEKPQGEAEWTVVKRKYCLLITYEAQMRAIEYGND